MVKSIPKMHTPRPALYTHASDAGVSAYVESRVNKLARAGNVDISTTPMPNDSANFSSQQKEGGFVKRHWSKMFLGAAAVTLGAVLSKGKFWAKPQAQSFKKIHQNLAEIFGKKDLTKKQAKAMLKKYRELSQIENKTEYTEKLFEQVKQDFGYGNNERIYLFRNDNPKNFASFNQNTGEMGVHVSLSRSDIFVAFCHEFTHVKQHEIAFRTIGAKEKAVEKDIEHLKKLNPKGYIRDPEGFVRCCRSRVDGFFEGRKRVFGDLPKFEAGSAEDILGRQYMDAEYYTTPEFYENNLLEQEAFRNGDLAEEVFRYISAMK